MKPIASLLLYAVLCNSVYAQSSIDEQIAQILQAPQKERVELMNQLKMRLAAMNANERAEAIRKLQMGVNGNHAASYNGANLQMQQIRSGIQQQHSMGAANASPKHGGR